MRKILQLWHICDSLDGILYLTIAKILSREPQYYKRCVRGFNIAPPNELENIFLARCSTTMD